MQSEKKNYNIIFLKVAVFCGLLLLAVTAIFLFRINKKTQLIEPIKSTVKTSSNFPLKTDVNSAYTYNFYCTITDLTNENISYVFGAGQYDYIIFKLLAYCVYLDIENNQHEIVVPLGSIIENQNGFFVAYSDRSFYAYPIDSPNMVMGSTIKERIEEYEIKDGGQLDDFELESGLQILVTFVDGENVMAQSGVTNPNGSSDFIYYGSGFTKSWESENLINFTQTGDSKYLPSLPDGRKFAPVLRAGVTNIRNE